jgi:polyphosphate kinase
LGPANPFPRLINRSLNVAFVLQDTTKPTEDERIAFVQLPSVLQRFVRLDRKGGHHFVLVEQLIKEFANILFPGLQVKTANTFRVTRDADIEIAEDEAEDLLSEIAEQIKKRRWGRAAVRLEVSSKMPDFLVELLTEFLDLDPIDVYVHDRPLNLGDFMEFMKVEIRDLKDKPFAPRNIHEFNGRDINIFDTIKQQDVLVHHPYDSFTTSTLKFISQAVNDPNVLAIKITLYRTGQNSPIVNALKKAAEDGKSVTAFVELKARFDEEKNITWAKELEHHGVHVVYGVLGLKTHCKICSVVRKENDQLRTYLHLSTGNYNQTTSRLYTDLGFFTANPDFGKDATHLFNILTGYSHFNDWKEFIVAPTTMYKRTLELIEREIELSTPENPGLIFAKMNQLAHREVIPALYRASQAGVKIKLLVRGLCCLRPGVEGISDNIEVRSIIGRFLEHSRIFYFKNAGNEEYYLSSADWMSRNLHKRMELMFPIYDKRLRERIWDILNIYWSDNTKAWKLKSTGEYEKLKPKNIDAGFSSQDFFLDELKLLRNSDILV